MVAILCGGFADVLTGSGGILYISGLIAIVCSILGLAGSLLEKHKLIGGVLMILSAIGIFIGIFVFGILSAILFFIGGVLMIVEHLNEKKNKPQTPTPTV